MAKGKVADRIQTVISQRTLKQGDYPGISGPDIVTGGP